MKTVGKFLLGLFGVVFAISIILALTFGGRYVALEFERFFAPKEQNVQREVFEKTKSYNEAKEQELIKYKVEYDRGDEQDKRAIASAVRLAFADYNDSELDPELRNFVRKCKYGE